MIRPSGLKKICLLFITCACLLFSGPALAGETVNITADEIEHDGRSYTYFAKGHVKAQSGTAIMQADAVRYNEKTSEAAADGNVQYEDPDVLIRAVSAEMNLEKKTGRLRNAEIFYKKDNFHVTGSEIIKKGEKEYYVSRAALTTCDAPVPEWCIKGRDVDITVGDRLRARDITFNIKDTPVLYSPYFSASIDNDRKTGLLMPDISYIKSKGIRYTQPFFWAISENRDATLVLDLYSNSGIGEGLEYRHVEQDGSRGSYWFYHLRDEKQGKDFREVRGIYENREAGRRLSGYLTLNYVNSRDFYNEYNSYVISRDMGFLDPASYLNRTTERFLQSTGEVSLNLEGSRLYLNAGHLIDLKQGINSADIAQKLPEIGYFINPRNIGPVTVSFYSAIANFQRSAGASGQRIDVYPRLSYAFGDTVVFTQNLGLRETAYALSNTDAYPNTIHREGLDYSVTASARLIKDYGSFVHIMEPSLGYVFIPSANTDMPLFDSTELYSKTSKTGIYITNRFMDTDGEFLTVRAGQEFDVNMPDHPFLPLRLEVALQKPVFLRGDISFDYYTGRVESLNSDITLNMSKAFLSAGERYSRTDNILFYAVSAGYAYSKALSAEAGFWYNADNGGLDSIIAKVKYQKQCWGITLIAAKRQEDYSISVLFDLLGLGTLKI